MSAALNLSLLVGDQLARTQKQSRPKADQAVSSVSAASNLSLLVGDQLAAQKKTEIASSFGHFFGLVFAC